MASARTLLTTRSDRVKCVDVHESLPLVAMALYDGSVSVWDYGKQALVRTIPVSEQPVRTARFLAKRGWLIAGADDGALRVYSVSSGERLFEVADAHADYVRDIAVCATGVHTCGDDMVIREWAVDAARGLVPGRTYAGHAHYVLGLAASPRDGGKTFASASLDRTIKVWACGSASAQQTLSGHEKSVNCVAYYPASARQPYVLSGSDEGALRVWDLPARACVRTASRAHGGTPVMAVAAHPTQPLVFSAGEDGAVRVWHAQTLVPAGPPLSPGVGRLWTLSLSVRPEGVLLVAGGDDGAFVALLEGGAAGGPAASLDAAGGRLVCARDASVSALNVRQGLLDAGADESKYVSGRILCPSREMGAADAGVVRLAHAHGGRHVAAVLSTGEFVVYSALGWRSRLHGAGSDVAWASGDPETLAVLEGPRRIVAMRALAPSGVLPLSDGSASRLFGGPLLGAATAAADGGRLCFFSWADLSLVGALDVDARGVEWSPDARCVAVLADGAVFVLSADLRAGGGESDVFSLVAQYEEKISHAAWLSPSVLALAGPGGVFLAVPSASEEMHQVSPAVGGGAFLVGCVDGHLVFADGESGVSVLGVSSGLVSALDAIGRGESDRAASIAGGLSADERLAVAQLLAAAAPAAALRLDAGDASFRVSLALRAGRLEDALATARAGGVPASSWRAIADAALLSGAWDVAAAALERAGDHAGLLLLHAARDDTAALGELGRAARLAGKENVALAAFVRARLWADAADLLRSAGKHSLAALAALRVSPDLAEAAVDSWRQSLSSSVAATILPPDAVSPLSANGRAPHTASPPACGASDDVFAYDTPLVFAGRTRASSVHSEVPTAADSAAASEHFSLDVHVGTASVRSADELSDAPYDAAEPGSGPLGTLLECDSAECVGRPPGLPAQPAVPELDFDDDPAWG